MRAKQDDRSYCREERRKGGREGGRTDHHPTWLSVKLWVVIFRCINLICSVGTDDRLGRDGNEHSSSSSSGFELRADDAPWLRQ